MREASTSPPVDGRPLAGRYELINRIGSGGMGTVWVARDRVLDRRVAVKILHPHLAGDPAVRARFSREATTISRLRHPGIVALYDIIVDPPALVLELIEGRDLAAVLAAHGPLDPPTAVAVARAAAAALDVAHRRGVVHRDVCPANILVSDDGRVVLADFGIARLLDDRTGLTGDAVVGTAAYLAPEQVTGAGVGPAADVWALGAVLFEMLTGRPPFRGPTPVATATARIGAAAPPVTRWAPATPADLVELVGRMLAPDPADRPADGGAVRVALDALEPLGPPTGTLVDLEVTGATAVARTSVLGTHPGAVPSPDRASAVARSERAWLVPASFVVLVVAAVSVAAGLLSRGPSPLGLLSDARGAIGDALRPSGPAGEARHPAAVRVVDPPPGDGTENDDHLVALTDGDPETAWSTERYRSRRFGGLKDGVGLLIDTGGARVRELVVEGSGSGWAAEVHRLERPVTDRSAWGPPVASGSDLGPVATFPLGDGGRWLVLWITDLGGTGGRLTISELTLR